MEKLGFNEYRSRAWAAFFLQTHNSKQFWRFNTLHPLGTPVTHGGGAFLPDRFRSAYPASDGCALLKDTGHLSLFHHGSMGHWQWSMTHSIHDPLTYFHLCPACLSIPSARLVLHVVKGKTCSSVDTKSSSYIYSRTDSTLQLHKFIQECMHILYKTARQRSPVMTAVYTWETWIKNKQTK